MPRKAKPEPSGWGICVDHLDGTFGWVIVGNGEPFVSENKSEVEKFLKKLLLTPKYSFSRPISVRKYELCKKS